MQLYTHLQAEDVREAVTGLSLPARIHGSNPPSGKGAAAELADEVDETRDYRKASGGGPHWT